LPLNTQLILGPPADTIALTTHPPFMDKGSLKYTNGKSVSVLGVQSQ
jgi:hypothetical protein